MEWEYKDGSGLWQEYVNKQTGESSLKEHKLKVVTKWCHQKKCIWRHSDEDYRTLVCKKCGRERPFVVGLHKLVKGKIVEIGL